MAVLYLNKAFIILFIIVQLLGTAFAFTSAFQKTRNFNSIRSFEIHSSTPTNNDFEKWMNPEYTEGELNALWNKHESLLTVGSKGLSDGQISSLAQLLSQHDIVRVKLANDKMDVMR